MPDYREGEIIGVFGGVVGKEERSVDSIQLCFKFQLEPRVLSSAKVLTPMIGDLVVAFTRKYSSDVPEKTSGILYKITYKLGKADKCVLLCGSEMVSVSSDNLIVLHRPGKE